MSEHVHGRLDCRACFAGAGPDDMVLDADGYRLVNDPGYWGAPDPVVLVLGQSKGRTQWRAAAGDFDAVAFAGARQELRAILERVGVPTGEGRFDDRFTAGERNLGFASLVRCSLSTDDGRSSPSPVTRAMGSPADRWVRTCMQRWLTDLNPRLRLVVLLGITDAYVTAVISRLRDLHPSTFRPENSTTVHAAGVVWTFVLHPSGQAVNHRQTWLGEQPLDKRSNAAAAVRVALSVAAGTAEPQPAMPPADVSGLPRQQGASRAWERGSALLPRAIEEYLEEHPDLVRRGALIRANKKMSDWRSTGGTVFAHEHQGGRLWTPAVPRLRELAATIAHQPYPRSKLWTTVGSDGQPRYGRHSALRTIPELSDADLLRFAPSTVAEAVRIVATLLSGDEDGVTGGTA